MRKEYTAVYSSFTNGCWRYLAELLYAHLNHAVANDIVTEKFLVEIKVSEFCKVHF